MQAHYENRTRLDNAYVERAGLFGPRFMYAPYHRVPLDLSQLTPHTISTANPQYIVPISDFDMIIPQDRDSHYPSAFHVAIETDGSLSITHGSNSKIKLSGKRVLVVTEDARGHIDKGALAKAIKASGCDTAVVVALNTRISASSDKGKDIFNMVLQAQSDLRGVSVNLGSGVPSDSSEKLAFFASPTSITRSATGVTPTMPAAKDTSAPPEITQPATLVRIVAPPTFRSERIMHPLGSKKIPLEMAYGAVESIMGSTLTEFNVGVCTTEGSRSVNEDQPKVAVYILPNGMQVLDMTVKDGAGGHQAGDIAALEANAGGSRYLEALANENGQKEQVEWQKLLKEADELKKNDPKLKPEEALGLTLALRVLRAENAAVYKWSRDSKSNGRSTRSGAIIIGDMAFIANVGDSRTGVYDERGRVIRVTKDHSLVQRLVDTHQISQKQALDHPARNVIYRALGKEVTVDAEMGKDIFMCRIPVGGTVAIHCDGINGGLDEVRPGEKVGPLVSKKNREVKDIAREVVEQAAPTSGDNDTIIVARRIK